MNIYVYSDESGVFDKAHNDVFVFGGLVFLSTEDRDIAARKYLRAERTIRQSGNYKRDEEIKASRIKNGEKQKLYRAQNAWYKFGAVVDQKRVIDPLMADKKAKQRFLDYALKIGVKRLFEKLIAKGIIVPSEVENIYFFVDEHNTATDGRYELHQSLEEFKRGMYSSNYRKFLPPIFPQSKTIDVKFCNSANVTLVRAADIVANKIYHDATSGKAFAKFDAEKNRLNIAKLP